MTGLKNDYFNEDVYIMLEQLDSQTLRHCIRVANIAKQVQKELSLSEDLYNAAMVHDIGKIYISNNILNKPQKLNQLERNIVNLHSYFGFRILKNLNVSDDICYIILFHHGKNVLTLENIPLCNNPEILNYAHMLHTIDSYEALTSDRVFRKRFTREKALEIMESEGGHQKQVMDLFKNVRIL